MRAEHPRNPDHDWAITAVHVAAALDAATDELAALIDGIRKRREKGQEPSDARREP